MYRQWKGHLEMLNIMDISKIHIQPLMLELQLKPCVIRLHRRRFIIEMVKIGKQELLMQHILLYRQTRRERIIQ